MRCVGHGIGGTFPSLHSQNLGRCPRGKGDHNLLSTFPPRAKQGFENKCHLWCHYLRLLGVGAKTRHPVLGRSSSSHHDSPAGSSLPGCLSAVGNDNVAGGSKLQVVGRRRRKCFDSLHLGPPRDQRLQQSAAYCSRDRTKPKV